MEEPEKVIWQGSPSQICYLPRLLGGIFLVTLALIMLAFNVTHDAVAISSALLFSTIVAVPGIYFIVFSILDRKTRIYTITDLRVSVRFGILTKQTNEIRNVDIKSVATTEMFFERLFGLGSVSVGSAGTNEYEVEFFGVDNPTEIKTAINNARPKE